MALKDGRHYGVGRRGETSNRKAGYAQWPCHLSIWTAYLKFIAPGLLFNRDLVVWFWFIYYSALKSLGKILIH